MTTNLERLTKDDLIGIINEMAVKIEELEQIEKPAELKKLAMN